MRMARAVPRNIAQWTGIVVAAIVTLGCDVDVAYAMPLGVFAGALATFFVALAESRAPLRWPVARVRFRK
jgi:hypothetical protein